MIKKILCPTDFSPSSLNAIEYASNFSQKFDASLVLLNVQKIHISDGISFFALKEAPSHKEANLSAASLNEMCITITDTYKISCGYEIIPTISSFEEKVISESDKFNVMVIGTNGADSLYQFFFGSHSFRIAKKTVCPVLIVPENCPYRNITKILFVSDYSKGDEFTLNQIKLLTEVYNAQLHVVHISRKDTDESREAFESFRNIIDMELKRINVSFERIIETKVADGIDNYIHKSNADLIGFNMKEHGFFYRAFHMNIIEKLTATAELPLIIYHN